MALLDQSRVAGIGNVYKSEVLFLCALSPFTPVADLDDVALDRVLATARRQMRRNLDSVSRSTRGVPGTTYFCPLCQPPRE